MSVLLLGCAIAGVVALVCYALTCLHFVLDEPVNEIYASLGEPIPFPRPVWTVRVGVASTLVSALCWAAL